MGSSIVSEDKLSVSLSLYSIRGVAVAKRYWTTLAICGPVVTWNRI